MTFWEFLFPVDIALAAFMGTTALLLGGKKRERTQMITTVLSNYLISIYLTGLVAEMTGFKSITGIAFVIAFGGFKVVERTVDEIFEKMTTNNSKDNGSADN